MGGGWDAILDRQGTMPGVALDVVELYAKVREAGYGKSMGVGGRDEDKVRFPRTCSWVEPRWLM